MWRNYKKSILLQLVAVMLWLPLVASCAETETNSTVSAMGLGQSESERQLQQQGKLIETLVKDKSCQVTAQCQAIPMGVKSCGGPTHYLVYNRTTIDELDLQKQIDLYNQLSLSVNQESQLVSDCALISMPNVRCELNICLATPAKTGASIE